MDRFRQIFCFSIVVILLMTSLRFAGATSEGRSYGPVVWEYLETLCEFGPRFFNSLGLKKTRELILDTGRKYAMRTKSQHFSYSPESGKTPLKLVNIELRFGPLEGRPLLIGTHYDTRPRADEDPNPANRLKPILGANDGGSGTALLLGLAKALNENPPFYPIVLVFFDGEDYGEKGSTEYLLGSQYYAEDLKLKSESEWPSAVLVVDMVGDRKLEIYRESYSMKSAPHLMNLIFSLARDKRGLTQFKNSIKYSIIDDHMPFTLLGIPSAVLIDFDYPHWHKQSDTLEQCSLESLMAVFSVLMDLVAEWKGKI
tara:strand:- start:4856 stop:5794 length:939 start_codon:yes stop_codon:yes gene_type:complete